MGRKQLVAFRMETYPEGVWMTFGTMADRKYEEMLALPIPQVAPTIQDAIEYARADCRTVAPFVIFGTGILWAKRGPPYDEIILPVAHTLRASALDGRCIRQCASLWTIVPPSNKDKGPSSKPLAISKKGILNDVIGFSTLLSLDASCGPASARTKPGIPGEFCRHVGGIADMGG